MALRAVYRPNDEFMANSLKDLLDESGIPAMIHSFQIPAYDGLAMVMRPVWGEILVEEDDLDRATELVEGFLAAEAGDDAGGDG